MSYSQKIVSIRRSIRLQIRQSYCNQASNPPCWCYTATHKQMYEMPFHLRHLEHKSALPAAGRTSYHPSMHEMSLANAKYTPILFPVPRDRNNGPSSRNYVARYMSAFLHVLRIIPSTLPWGEQPPSAPGNYRNRIPDTRETHLVHQQAKQREARLDNLGKSNYF